MSSLLEYFIDNKLLKIVRLFIERDEELFSLYLISQETKVPIGSVFRIMKKLADSGVVETINVGKTKLYRTNKKTMKELAMLKQEVKK